MTDKAREEMSALMDGEATELEFHRVLKCSETDDELRASWRRYHVVRSVVRGEARDKAMLTKSSIDMSLDIATAVSQAIADEPSYGDEADGLLTERDQVASKKSNPWVDKVLRPFGSVAVAASVSAMVIFGWQSTGGFNSQQVGAPAVAAVSVPSIPTKAVSGFVNDASTVYAASRIPAFNGRTNGYILADDSAQQVSRSGSIPSQDVIRLQIPRDDRFNRYILSHSGNAAFNTVSGAIPYARVVTLKSSSRSVK
ncbi:MAG: sigma-E factor negative regulatory protein [Pseudomonadales bacterium]|nr:sigma-E factor negative regulatory protein [Pseudomonadales bacterium]